MFLHKGSPQFLTFTAQMLEAGVKPCNSYRANDYFMLYFQFCTNTSLFPTLKLLCSNNDRYIKLRKLESSVIVLILVIFLVTEN